MEINGNGNGNVNHEHKSDKEIPFTPPRLRFASQSVVVGVPLRSGTGPPRSRSRSRFLSLGLVLVSPRTPHPCASSCLGEAAFLPRGARLTSERNSPSSPRVLHDPVRVHVKSTPRRARTASRPCWVALNYCLPLYDDSLYTSIA
jgi:hypothetical protein